MIAININVTRIDKTALYQGKNGTYLSLTMHENKNGKDQYGNDGFVAQDVGKERRAKGEKGPILGNYKTIGGFIGEQTDHNQAKSNGYQVQQDDDDSSIPF
jgi:hypothetical protein